MEVSAEPCSPAYMYQGPRKQYADLAERIVANTAIDWESWYDGEPCWIWMGKLNSVGYGFITIRMKRGPRKGKPVPQLAHRMSVMAFKKRSVSGRQVVKHLCNQRRCCNPHHLRGGTQISNMRQMVREGRHGNMYRSPVRDMENAG